MQVETCSERGCTPLTCDARESRLQLCFGTPALVAIAPGHQRLNRWERTLVRLRIESPLFLSFTPACRRGGWSARFEPDSLAGALRQPVQPPKASPRHPRPRVALSPFARSAMAASAQSTHSPGSSSVRQSPAHLPAWSCRHRCLIGTRDVHPPTRVGAGSNSRTRLVSTGATVCLPRRPLSGSRRWSNGSRATGTQGHRTGADGAGSLPVLPRSTSVRSFIPGRRPF
jgi:hypothetical protein